MKKVCHRFLHGYYIQVSPQGERRLDKLTEMITEANPMGFPMTVNTKHYEAKVKRLLMDFALARQSVFHA